MPDLLERLQNALAGRYAIRSELGRGGMATVFLAQDLKHHRRVALKVLHPEIAAALGPDRFHREIETVAALTHPHILPLHDSGEAGGLLYYTMPFVEGESLRERLARERQLPVEEAVRIAREVAGALEHAHRHGLVHRDVKPGNILLEEGHAVVADFGVARAVRDTGGEKMTATGLAVGTPAYMSPEQAAGEEVDARADVYALGCVLYEMLAGEPPLTGATPQSTAAKRLTDRPTPLTAIRSTIPESLQSLVERTLATSAADRPDTARALAEELRSIRTSPQSVAGGSRVTRWLMPLIGLAVSVLAVAVWRQSQSAPEDTARAEPSIAVLPFADISPDGDQEFFSDGMSEELLNLLTRVPGLRVTARSSAFYFKGRNLPAAEIAARLGVSHVLEGSVRKDGDLVRVSVQLVDARLDAQVWGDTWERTLDDIFVVQDEIAAAVAQQLKVRLLSSVPAVREVDPEAYILVLRARQLRRQGSIESLEASTALYKQALDVDPEFAAAWDELAGNYIDQAGQSGNALLPVDDGHRLAREAANRALAIDPEYAPAYAHLASIAMSYDRDLVTAARYVERALVLDPKSPETLAVAAVLARILGHPVEAVPRLEFVVANDPLNPLAHQSLGRAYRSVRRTSEAIRSFRTALSLSPGMTGVHNALALAFLDRGEPEAALAEIQQEPAPLLRSIYVVLVYDALGRVAEADAALGELMAEYQQEAAYNIAFIHAERGDADGAFEWLDRAVQYNDVGLTRITYDPLFENIHDDPRWLPFLASLGRAPGQLAAIRFDVRLLQ